MGWDGERGMVCEEGREGRTVNWFGLVNLINEGGLFADTA